MAARDDTALKRLGGGRWQTRDGRFTIEPQSGTWVVVDAEATDELGLALVRGPYGTLTAAKDAIADAREGDAPASPLAGALARVADMAEPQASDPRRGRRRQKVEGQATPATEPTPAPTGPERARGAVAGSSWRHGRARS